MDMTPEQIREIVRMTVEELTQRKLLEINKINYSAMLQVVDKYLYGFFSSRSSKGGVGHILNRLSDDPYIDIIFLQYRDAKTLEWIAEYLGVDVSTIKRNKKRLITKIYELLEV